MHKGSSSKDQTRFSWLRHVENDIISPNPVPTSISLGGPFVCDWFTQEKVGYQWKKKKKKRTSWETVGLGMHSLLFPSFVGCLLAWLMEKAIAHNSESERERERYGQRSFNTYWNVSSMNRVSIGYSSRDASMLWTV